MPSSLRNIQLIRGLALQNYEPFLVLHGARFINNSLSRTLKVPRRADRKYDDDSVCLKYPESTGRVP